MPFLLCDSEAVVINNINDFELSLVLKRKESNIKILTENIKKRIEEKSGILSMGHQGGICLVGHSQIDNWDIKSICGKIVRNCGIRGISSFEYNHYILEQGRMDCAENTYVVMHGTNDIVYDYSDRDIVLSIKATVEFIRKRKPISRIIMLPVLHVNGRLDRNNQRIDALNVLLHDTFKEVEWVDCSEMDDEFGNLAQEFTIDGLHLSDAGYEKLHEIIEKAER